MKPDFPALTSVVFFVAASIMLTACALLFHYGTFSTPFLFVLPVLTALISSALLFIALRHRLHARKHAQNHLLDEKKQLQLALDSAGECLWEWQLADGNTSIYFSASYCAMLGYPQSGFANNQQGWQGLLHPDEREHVYRRIHALFESSQDCPYENTYRMRHRDGSYRWIHSRGQLFIRNGKPERFIGIAADISEERAKAERLRLANVVFDSTHEGVLITDANNIITFVNPAFSTITGYASDEIIGLTPRALQSGRHSKEFYAEMWRSLYSKDSWTGEIWNRRKSGEVLPQLQTIAQLRDEHGLITHRVAVFSDIALLKHSQSELSFLAHYDPLTSLPNRTLLHEHLKLSLQRASKAKKCAALLVIDIDHFKIINESLGHARGDELLKLIIARIQKIIDPLDTLSRFGGDEFALICDSCTSNVQAADLAEKIMALFKLPFLVNQQDIFMTASIGICLYPNMGSAAEEIFRNAETALTQAKAAGRACYAFYNSALTDAAARKLRTANELRTAIDENQLLVFYQPVYDLHQQQVIGCEALVRWQHPERGLVMPFEFIPVAEETGLISAIDTWVLREACQQAQHWIEQGLKLDFVSVNISSRLFDRGDMLQTCLQAALSDSQLPAALLELEITESAMMGDPDQSIQLLRSLRETGVRLAIDDFGTGYSSLGRLKHLPVDKFKIDRAFVQNLPAEQSDIAIIKAIIALAKSLCLQVQAEGVETTEQAKFLRQNHCALAQGYLYGKPMPAAEFAPLLRPVQP
ncbi:MAG: EAL domain-containing protein [Thiopseudomonas sp.]|nr:EAL domain-containing protein [Thiopseudomonas sp.]